MRNRCRRCGGTYLSGGDPKSTTGIALRSCVNCGDDPTYDRRPPARLERRPQHARTTLTRYQERSIETLTKGGK